MAAAFWHYTDKSGVRIAVEFTAEQVNLDASVTRAFESLEATASAGNALDANGISAIREAQKLLPTARASHWESELQRIGVAAIKQVAKATTSEVKGGQK